MAKDTLNQDKSDEPLYGAFRFYQSELDQAEIGGKAACDFAARAGNVAMGVRTILEILHDEDLRRMNRGDGEDDPKFRPLFSPYDQEALQRLATESMRALTESSDHFLKWAYECHTPDGRKARADAAAWQLRQKG